MELNTLGAVIKTTYEGQSDTNAFTDAEKTKLDSMVPFSGSYVDLTNKPTIPTGSYADLTGKPALDFVPTSQRGTANGVAPLDAAGLVPLIHLNVSGLSFKGAWNPVTNLPPLLNGVGTVGDFYKASAAGTFNFGTGDFVFAMGDWVIFAAGVWQRLGVSDSVAMVNGKLGTVVLTAADVGARPSSYVPAWSEITSKPSLVNTVNGQSGAVTIAAPTWAALPDKPVLYVPPKLTYANRLGSRVAATWYTNGPDYDRIVNITTNYTEASASSTLTMRAPGTTTPTFIVRATAIGTGSSNQIVQARVPAGWQYNLSLGASRTVSEWFEGDYA